MIAIVDQWTGIFVRTILHTGTRTDTLSRQMTACKYIATCTLMVMYALHDIHVQTKVLQGILYAE